MANVSVVLTRDYRIANTNHVSGDTVSVETGFAADLVWHGAATYVSPPSNVEPVDSEVTINASQIADAGASGLAIIRAANFDAFLTAIGATLGVADSGGTGFKLIRVTNATT